MVPFSLLFGIPQMRANARTAASPFHTRGAYMRPLRARVRFRLRRDNPLWLSEPRHRQPAIGAHVCVGSAPRRFTYGRHIPAVNKAGWRFCVGDARERVHICVPRRSLNRVGGSRTVGRAREGTAPADQSASLTTDNHRGLSLRTKDGRVVANSAIGAHICAPYNRMTPPPARRGRIYASRFVQKPDAGGSRTAPTGAISHR